MQEQNFISPNIFQCSPNTSGNLPSKLHFHPDINVCVYGGGDIRQGITPLPSVFNKSYPPFNNIPPPNDGFLKTTML